jgi:transcriptional regulator
MVKLTEAQVRYIRSSPLSQRKLAKELGVTQPAIGMIRRRVNWGWLE